jgi:predicted RNase H-like HicB family nuclease
MAQQDHWSEQPPRFSVRCRAAIRARLVRSAVTVGGCRSVRSFGCDHWPSRPSPSDWTRARLCGYLLPTDMRIELDREEDGRWLTEIPELPGVMAYGQTRDEALARVKALALRVMADRLEHGEAIPELVDVFSVAA